MSGLTERLNQSALDLTSIDSIESTISNCLRVAAERFEQHVKDLTEGTNGMETIQNEQVRAGLAQQFAAQHAEAKVLIHAIDAHGLATLVSHAK